MSKFLPSVSGLLLNTRRMPLHVALDSIEWSLKELEQERRKLDKSIDDFTACAAIVCGNDYSDFATRSASETDGYAFYENEVITRERLRDEAIESIVRLRRARAALM